MSPKVTLSIPEDLSKKMEKWKDKFNFSSVFQEAISKQIEKKEDFIKKIAEEPTMGAIIERLKKEKMDSSEEFYEIGRRDGLVWARHAAYRELKYVVDEYKAMFEISEAIVSCNPARDDEILGDYFKEIFAEYEDQGMGYTETSYSNCIPNEAFEAWEKGWKEAIEEFWDEIKDKI